ncbi:hypothetical protein [Marispirochaeta aestuarii]|uniref:hypothetical protein n=1 Tax=Marispirochaeta aestuarii TaxID=1963862 RepID=UPI0029C976C3|nr:hypothetical protein [Marispirochaeta aestuarii]
MGSLLSRARMLRERPLHPSQGLLRKARSLQERITGRPSADIESLDPRRTKEQEIMAEMDSILEQNRLAITDETLKFSALSSGARFPVILNLTAAVLMLVVGTGLFFLFNRGEASQVDLAGRISSAESRIISAVREESRQELARKEEEINSINRQLRQAQEARVALIAETENELLRREAQLKEEMSRELEAERRRLLAAGLDQGDLDERLSRYREQQQGEYEEQLAAVNAELEARLEERSAELNQQMEEYRQALSSARTEQESIQERLATARDEAARAVQEAGSDRSAALDRLETLNRQQGQKTLVEEHLLSMYDGVNTQLQRGEYREASLQLDRIEEFINSSAAETIMVLNNRMEVEQFILGSLRRLIAVEAGTGGELPRFGPLLASVSARVEEGNRLFSEGNLEEAGKAYTEALNTIPEIETGYARLQEIEEGQLARERSLLEERLAEGDRLYREARYQASVDRYREALGILERQAPPLDQLVTHLMDAGYHLRSGNEAQPEPVIITRVIREEIPAEDTARIEKARAEEERRRLLLEQLDLLRSRYAEGSSTQESKASRQALITLLNTKLLIRQALASEEVRRQYPDLYRNADEVLDMYGEEQRREGKTEALRDVVAITDYLENNPSSSPPTATAESARQRELLLQFLENLKELLGE